MHSDDQRILLVCIERHFNFNYMVNAVKWTNYHYHAYAQHLKFHINLAALKRRNLDFADIEQTAEIVIILGKYRTTEQKVATELNNVNVFMRIATSYNWVGCFHNRFFLLSVFSMRRSTN